MNRIGLAICLNQAQSHLGECFSGTFHAIGVKRPLTGAVRVKAKPRGQSAPIEFALAPGFFGIKRLPKGCGGKFQALSVEIADQADMGLVFAMLFLNQHLSDGTSEGSH